MIAEKISRVEVVLTRLTACSGADKNNETIEISAKLSTLKTNFSDQTQIATIDVTGTQEQEFMATVPLSTEGCQSTASKPESEKTKARLPSTITLTYSDASNERLRRRRHSHHLHARA